MSSADFVNGLLSDVEQRIDDGHNIWGNMSLPELAKEQGVEEIVVAIEEPPRRRVH